LAVDEFQETLRLPVPLADVLVTGRSHGLALVVAHQHLGQLTADVKAALFGNAGSRIAFGLNHEDAAVFARDSRQLTTDDFMGLGSFEAYASVMTQGARTPYASVRTRPLSPPLRDPATLREASALRWGTPVADIEAGLREIVRPTAHTSAPVGRRPRTGGAP
jgi:hypothetical protein